MSEASLRRPFAFAVAIAGVALLLACSSAREAEPNVVDVVVAAPSASAVAVASAAPPAHTVKVAVDPRPSASSATLDEDPRRVLRPSLAPPLVSSSTLPPQTATPLPPAGVGVLSAALTALVATHAAGSSPDGQPIAGNFKQGDRLHLPVMLQPGRCYTVVAASAGISELDIALMIGPSAGLPFPPMALAVDSTTGPTAVVGPSPNCFKNPTPIAMPAVAVITATAGAGAVIAQAFSR